MATNIGIDIGTTYTTVTYEDHGQIKVYECHADNTKTIKSLVAYDPVSQEMSYGQQAQIDSYEPDCLLFKGFKVLLTESDKDLLKENHYIDYTPEDVFKKYLGYILTSFMNDTGITHIDKICVGIPEIWKNQLKSIDAKNKIPSLFEGITYKNHKIIDKENIELISEPEAACACFVVDNNKKSTHHYCGYCLVIDYGGGTLDMALCHVELNENISDISVIDHCGKGANTEKRIGKAGLAFFEELAKIAIEEEIAGEVLKDNDYYKIVDRLEREFKATQLSDKLDVFLDQLLRRDFNHQKFIKIMNDIDYVKEFNEKIKQRLNEDNHHLMKVRYHKHIVTLDYWMVIASYQHVIYDVLQKSLEYMKKSMDEKGIKYDLSQDKIFKILMVGGFSKFSLTQRHVKSFFKISSGADERFDKVNAPDIAVAYGLGYFANQYIRFKRQAPHSIGIMSDGHILFCFEEGEIYKIDEAKYFTYQDGTERRFKGDGIPKLYFKSKQNHINVKQGVPPTRDLQEKLVFKYRGNPNIFYAIGFSFGKNDVLTLHIKIKEFIVNPQTHQTEYQTLEYYPVELTNMFDWFGGLITPDY